MANRRHQNEPSRPLPWGPMILSFVIGAFVMFLLHLKDNVPQDDALNTKQEAESAKKAIEPTFDFFTLLPETEVVVDIKKDTQQALMTSPALPTTQDKPTSEPRYIVQVGSFKKLADADALRAKLAFLGIESKVQSVTIDNKETWHRVQVGPIAGRTQADSMQKRLKDNQIDSILMKAKQG